MKNIFIFAKVGRIFTILFLAALILGEVFPIVVPMWVVILSGVVCITIPVILSFWLLSFYRPYKPGITKEWNNDMIINWKAFGVLGILGCILLTVLMVAVFANNNYFFTGTEQVYGFIPIIICIIVIQYTSQKNFHLN